jgi:hypothetical protein
MVLSGLGVVLASFIPCPHIDNLCISQNLEDPSSYVDEVFSVHGNDQPLLLLMVIAGILVVLAFNVT